MRSELLLRSFNDPLKFLLILVLLAACAAPNEYTKVRKKTRITKVSTLRSKICRTASALEGSRYRYGGKSPAKGFDCSGFTSYVLRKHGVDLYGPSYSQAKKGQKVEIKKLKPGDLVFFKNKGKVNHVGLVLENNRTRLMVIHSTSTRGVVIDNIWQSNYWSPRLAFGRTLIP